MQAFSSLFIIIFFNSCVKYVSFCTVCKQLRAINNVLLLPYISIAYTQTHTRTHCKNNCYQERRVFSLPRLVVTEKKNHFSIASYTVSSNSLIPSITKREINHWTKQHKIFICAYEWDFVRILCNVYMHVRMCVCMFHSIYFRFGKQLSF